MRGNGFERARLPGGAKLKMNGPHDSRYLFKDFVKMMEEWKG